MFLASNPGSRRAGAAAIAAVGALALTACSDSSARTDLRPEGPPEVLAVLVLNDSVGGLVEVATFCKSGDEKRPSLVGLPDFTTTTLCPEDLTMSVPMAEDASPDTFYVRVMFDELLDPTIEDLIPILDENGLETGSFTGTLANTQPVTLQCTGIDGQLHDVAYDGYYSPSGNAVTWPVGPSLVIKQVGDVIVPTNSDCQVTLKDTILDKQGNQIPADQRGPFKFKVSGIKPLVVDPADESEVDAFAIYFDNFYTQFNTEVDFDSLCPDDGNGLCGPGRAFDLTPSPGGICAATGDPCVMDSECDAVTPMDTCSAFYAYSLAPFGFTPAEFGYGPIFPVEVEKDYTFTFKQGSKLKDQCGVDTTLGAPSAEKMTTVTVTTNPFKIKPPFSINNNDTVAANRKMRLPFTNVLDLTSIDPTTELSIDPLPFLAAGTPITPAQMLSTSTEGDIFIRGHYQPSTDYTFTLKAGAVIADAYGKEFTQAADTVIKFKTQAIAITASSPANGSTVVKATPTSVSRVTFTFNQGMDVTTFTIDDLEITGPSMPTGTSFSVGTTASSNCGVSSTGCQLRFGGVFAPGEYTVKLKKDAAFKDILGNDYIQPSDRTIKFTVEESTPSTPIPCLGA